MNGDTFDRLADDARVIGDARMRDEEKLTAEKQTEIFTRLRTYLDRMGEGLDWEARSMGFKSASTLSEILSGNYVVSGAKIEEHVRKINKWTEQQLAKEAAPKAPEFSFQPGSSSMPFFGLVRRSGTVSRFGS